MIYQDATLFYISTSTTAPREVIEIVEDTLIHIERNFTEELFGVYKKQTAFILQRILSDPFAEMEFLANNWLIYGRLVSPSEMIEGYYGLVYKETMDAAKKYIREDNLFIGILGKEDPRMARGAELIAKSG